MSHSAITDLNQSLPMPEGGIASKPILDLPLGTKAVLFALDQGQEISAHTAPFPAEVVVLEGRLDVLVGTDTRTLAIHEAVALPAGLPHGLKALEPSRFLLVMRRGAPAPAKAREEGCGSHDCSHGTAESKPA